MSGPLVESFAVATTLTSQRGVCMLSGTANTVAYPESGLKRPVGITIDDVSNTTQGIPVQLNGIAKLYFNDTVGAGQLVALDASGRGIPFSLASTTTSLTLASFYLGSLVDAAVAATGTIAKVLIAPGSDRSAG